GVVGVRAGGGGGFGRGFGAAAAHTDQRSRWLIGWMVFAISFANRHRISLNIKGIGVWSPLVWLSAVRGGDDGEDGVGEHAQRGVPVPRGPAAHLRLVQAD